jgi:hypothetical protein
LKNDPQARPAVPFKSNLPKGADGKPLAPSAYKKADENAPKNPRQSILTAFGELGGVRWLVKLGKKYPKDFASLLAKVMPQDVNVNGTIGYVPLVIPVEEREAIPGVCVDITPPALPVELDPFE